MPNPNGGSGPGCNLPPGMCRREAEVECASSNPLCEGVLTQHARLRAAFAQVTALAASKDGRVAVGGVFRTSLDLGGQVFTGSDAVGTGFVSVFDSDARLLWVRSVPDPLAQEITGLAFMSDGALVVRGSGWSFMEKKSVRFVIRYDMNGAQLWRRVFDASEGTLGVVARAPDGGAWLGGTFGDTFMLDGTALRHAGNAAYLLLLDRAGDLRDAFVVLPDGCSNSELTSLASDGAGRPLLTGACYGPGNVSSSFLQQRHVDGSTSFEKRYRGAPGFRFDQPTLAVDDSGYVTVGSTFQHGFEDDEGTSHLASDLGTNDGMWLARYEPTGKRSWLELFPSSRLAVEVRALAADPFGDVAMLGRCGELSFSDLPGSALDASECVLKFRDRTPLWAHRIEGSAHMTSVVADASAHLWLGGYFYVQVEYRGQLIQGNEETRYHDDTGLVLRLSP